MNVPRPEDHHTFSGLSDGVHTTYDFSRLGVRVPAFLISPYVPANSLIHDAGTMYAPNSAYTHTSFLHFLARLWGLDGLNNRVGWAKTFEQVFLPQARDPRKVPMPYRLETPKWYGGMGTPRPQVFYQLNQPYEYYKERGL